MSYEEQHMLHFAVRGTKRNKFHRNKVRPTQQGCVLVSRGERIYFGEIDFLPVVMLCDIVSNGVAYFSPCRLQVWHATRHRILVSKKVKAIVNGREYMMCDR
jgi:hypothetical protein